MQRRPVHRSVLPGEAQGLGVLDVDALGQLVVNRIQPVAGIVRTLTCPVVKL